MRLCFVVVSLLAFVSLANALTWDEVLRAQCQGVAARDCDVVISRSQSVVLEGNAEAASVTVRGNLLFGNGRPSVLSAGFIVAEGPEGRIDVGSEDSPAPAGSTIFIRNNGRSHSHLGKRSFGSFRSGASFHVHGEKMRKTWMLLSSTARAGDRSVVLDDNASTAGWKVGDRIAIAPTTSYPKFDFDSSAEVFTLTQVDGSRVYLDGPIRQSKAGYPSRKVQAEVINLSRSVLITGDNFDSSGHGLHVVAHSGGEGVVSYARIERGGQHGLAGKYPLHFHLAGSCPRCKFVGNAIENSKQRGIIIHGSHRTLVSENVLFDIKGSGIYVEDGNEMENTISYNVVICPIKNGCKTAGTDNNQADDLQQSGLWALSVSNDFIGNRLVNHYNGFFTQTSAFPHGRGEARGRVCTMFAPFGKFSGNVCHSNERFGFYLDNNFPRKLRRSVASNGLLDRADFEAHVDNNPNTFSSCDAFTESGADNGVTAVIEDQLEIGNSFSGQYALGDVQFLRWHSINNLHGIYWKETKAMADSKIVAHIKDSVFEWISSWDADSEIRQILGSPDSGVAAIAGPGGLGAFIIENTSFRGHLGDAIAANQHCGLTGTGGLCTPEYQLVNVDFSSVHPSVRRIRFGISDGNTVLPIFGTLDNSLSGYQSIASRSQTHLLGLNECRALDDRTFDNGIGCNIPLRRLQVWSSTGNQPGGAILIAPGGRRWEMEFIGPPNNNRMKQGYGAAVAVGQKYIVELDRDEGIVIEFSDQVFSDHFNTLDQLELELRFRSQPSANRVCSLTNEHSRAFINSDGPLRQREGLGACTSGITPTPDPISPPPPAEEGGEGEGEGEGEEEPSSPPAEEPSVPQTDGEMICYGETQEQISVEQTCDSDEMGFAPNPFAGEGYYLIDMRCKETSLVGCVGQSGCRLCHTDPAENSVYPRCPSCVCEKWGRDPSACMSETSNA